MFTIIFTYLINKITIFLCQQLLKFSVEDPVESPVRQRLAGTQARYQSQEETEPNFAGCHIVNNWTAEWEISRYTRSIYTLDGGLEHMRKNTLQVQGRFEIFF